MVFNVSLVSLTFLAVLVSCSHMSERDKIRTFPMLIRVDASSEAGRITPFAFLLMVTNAQVYKQVSRAFLKIPHQFKTYVLGGF